MCWEQKIGGIKEPYRTRLLAPVGQSEPSLTDQASGWVEGVLRWVWRASHALTDCAPRRPPPTHTQQS